MGGRGSGSFPDNPNQRGGRSKKSAIQVVGIGTPELPEWLPADAFPFWQDIVSKTVGVAFSQDSDAVAELASLIWRQSEFLKRLAADPTNDDWNRISLAIGRQARPLQTALGLTPHARQILVVPVDEPAELDPLEQLQQMDD
jgi:phage terminase small subunit